MILREIFYFDKETLEPKENDAYDPSYDDSIVTKGGRVLTVTAQGDSLKEAVKTAQNTLSSIQFEGMYFRRDIGYEFDS